MHVCAGVLSGWLALGVASTAEAQACAAELRALEDLHEQMRTELAAGHAAAAAAIWSRHRLETPKGYAYEGNIPCQKWFREVGTDHRLGCFLERARDQFEDMQKRQSVAPSEVAFQPALERVSRPASVSFSCQSKDELYLLCQPTAAGAPDSWCARRIDSQEMLEFPRDAACSVVDQAGDEVSTVVEGTELTCPDDLKSYTDAETQKVRAERRGTVAAAGTFIALMSAVAVPVTFVPQGVANLLRRLHVLHQSDASRLHHKAFRTRARILPLLGMTALSVSSLSSRFWWAGVLTAGCGITSDVLLGEYWHRGGSAKRAIGIATAVAGSVAGLTLNIETLTFSDVGAARAFVPTLRLGIAQLELGIAGRF